MSARRHGGRLHRAALESTPRRLLASAGVLLLAGGGLVGSGANFNATTANPRTVVTAGILSQSNSKNGEAILTAANMAPGDTETGTLDLGNTGDLPAAMSVTTASPVDTPAATAFSSYLRLDVDDLGSPTCTTGCPAPETIFRGPLAQAAGTSDLLVLRPGEKRRYRFKVTYPDGGGDGADNKYGGARTTVSITWMARQ